MPDRENVHKQELLKAATEAIAQSRSAGRPQLSQPARVGTRWGLVASGLAFLLVAAGWLIAARPAWIFPPPPILEPPEVTMASMRLALVRERQRVELFQQRTGRLPTSLAEAGGSARAIEFSQTANNGYVLRTVENGAALELRSSDRVEAFLGNSLQIVLDAERRP